MIITGKGDNLLSLIGKAGATTILPACVRIKETLQKRTIYKHGFGLGEMKSAIFKRVANSVFLVVVCLSVCLSVCLPPPLPPPSLNSSPCYRSVLSLFFSFYSRPLFVLVFPSLCTLLFSSFVLSVCL